MTGESLSNGEANAVFSARVSRRKALALGIAGAAAVALLTVNTIRGQDPKDAANRRLRERRKLYTEGPSR